MPNRHFKIALVGSFLDNQKIQDFLWNTEHIEIVSIINTKDPSLDSKQLLSVEDLDIVVETSDDSQIHKELIDLLKPSTTLITVSMVNFIVKLIQDKNRLLQEKLELLSIKALKSELDSILNSVQEGLQVASLNGIVKYVNPAYCRITGLDPSERIGSNIFTCSPDSALADCLRTKENIKGYHSRILGTDAEVIANASPIFIDDQIAGAVEVLTPITDMYKIMEELNKSTNIIQNLYDRLGQISESKYSFDAIIGNSEELRRVVRMAKKGAESNCPILVLGENGVGKELFAASIHSESPRKDKPFLKIDCASIPDSLIEAELFGSEKVGQNGEPKIKLGKFELANGGTVFLDEIGHLNSYIQSKLIRLLKELEYERVGGTEQIRVDVRIIASTNRNLRELIAKGEFKEELYYRLNLIELLIPPLRHRKEDIPLLISSFIEKLNRELGKKVKGITKTAEMILSSYNWPGNVGELENVIERAMVTTDDEIITHKHLSQYIEHLTDTNNNSISDLLTFEEMERILLKKALGKFGDSVEGKKMAAKALNISLATLYNKLKRYNMTTG